MGPRSGGRFAEVMVKLGIGLPRIVFYAYVAATLVEVALGRDDFPISRFPMFSRTRDARPSTKKFLMSVSEAGEQDLTYGEVRRLFGGDLAARVIFSGSGGKSDVRKRMMSKLVERIDELKTKGPRPYALRYYTQHFRDGHAVTKLREAVYAPPPTLLERLEKEARATAEPLPPEKVSQRDQVLELDESHCIKGCSKVDDPLASNGLAIRLQSSKRTPASAAFTLPGGSWFMLVRLKTKAGPPNDFVVFEVPEEKKAKRHEIGHHKDSLPAEGWVWTSSEPGYPALRLKEARDRRVTIVAGAEPIDIDQIWLSTKVSELPTWNAPVVPRKDDPR